MYLRASRRVLITPQQNNSLQPHLKTRRDRLKSAPCLKLKNIQGTTIGNICKKLIFFSRNFFSNFFFETSIFLSRRKTQKRPFRLIKRFYKPKKSKGVPFDRIRKVSKKSRKQTKKKRNETNLWYHIYFWKHKKICGLVRESNPRSPASKKNS